MDIYKKQKTTEVTFLINTKKRRKDQTKRQNVLTKEDNKREYQKIPHCT